jgi:ubiquinone biosynthesis protein COQ4
MMDVTRAMGAASAPLEAPHSRDSGPRANDEAYRADPKQAAKSLALALRPWDFGNINHTFRFVFATAGPIVKEYFDGFVESEHGPRLLKERPDILAALDDRKALRAMPKGSFADAYLQYMNAAGMASASYFNEMADIKTCAVEFGWDEEVTWFIERQAALHDIFHVLSGYDPSIEGEVGVFMFTAGQYPYKFIAATFLGVFLGLPTKFRFVRWARFIRTAYMHGRNAKAIGYANLEELLPKPLSEVRAELGITEFDELFPEGLPKGGWLYRKFDELTQP